MAEVDGTPVGTVRADFDGHHFELSWTIAPEARGRNIGKAMVFELAQRLNSPIRAEIKKENLASVRVARFLGMSLDREYNGFLHFSKKPSL
jgi:RimJ/RimL family protein N-acetyltransferase